MMIWTIKILGLGICVAILSMAVVAFFYKNATEADVTLMYVTIMDFIVIWLIGKCALCAFRKSR